MSELFHEPLVTFVLCSDTRSANISVVFLQYAKGYVVLNVLSDDTCNHNGRMRTFSQYELSYARKEIFFD